MSENYYLCLVYVELFQAVCPTPGRGAWHWTERALFCAHKNLQTHTENKSTPYSLHKKAVCRFISLFGLFHFLNPVSSNDARQFISVELAESHFKTLKIIKGNPLPLYLSIPQVKCWLYKNLVSLKSQNRSAEICLQRLHVKIFLRFLTISHFPLDFFNVTPVLTLLPLQLSLFSLSAAEAHEDKSVDLLSFCRCNAGARWGHRAGKLWNHSAKIWHLSKNKHQCFVSFT